jgi:hypothetical protein
VALAKKVLAVATGFFWLKDDCFYLITNWHNVTGWDVISGQCLSASGAVPTHVQMPLLLKSDEFDVNNRAIRRRYSINLYDADGTPTWLEHSVFGNRVDVVALKIALLDDDLISRPINTLAEFVDFDPNIGDDVFVLGYPGGIDAGHELALWKRGSIASHPAFDVDDLPKMLIDTATRKGMSGSPVIVRQRGLIVPRSHKGKAEGLSGEELIGQADQFLGVYSGRIGDDEFGLQLGIVWKASVLDEIVAKGKVGSSPFIG